MTLDEIMQTLRNYQNPKSIAGMARFGINPDNNYGVPMPILRSVAKVIGKDHGLALQLWSTGNHEARILASMVEELSCITEAQIESWVKDFNSWDVCDQCCSNLLDKTPYAVQKVFEWTRREEEFVKRAGFVLMATLSVHNKKMINEDFEEFFPVIYREATDNRNFVRKAVNWALRQIGKRSRTLNSCALEWTEKIALIDSKAARWIAADAKKELTSEKILKRIRFN